MISSKITPCESVPGTYLVRTCAEAGTNERIADYLQNTAWSIRGLEACISMLKPTGFDVSVLVNNACILKKSFDTIVEQKTINTPLGELVPFCLQYPVLPWTMSGCRKTTAPVDAEALEKYLTEPSSRSTTYDPTKQNFMENRYSNYRYYPELLSSCLLTPDIKINQKTPFYGNKRCHRGVLLFIEYNRVRK